MEILGRLSEPVRQVVRDRVDAAREMVDIVGESFSGRSLKLPLPPNWLRDVGPSDFEKTGQEFLRYFIELASLQPKEFVLDIGCGPGRMTLPLIGYLREGRYFGIDVNARAIRWCRRNISSRAPGFTFYHADIFNQRYNPSGKLGASEYVFPFDDDSQDFVFLTSVFTHMYPDDMKHYLLEIARLLRAGGRVFATFFLLNPVQRELASRGRNKIDFRFDRGPYRTRDDRLPESAIAVEESTIRAMFTDVHLRIREPIRFGTWSGREEGLSLQDIVLAEPRR